MKKQVIIPLLLVLVIGLCAPQMFAQATGTVKGVCKDANGQPIVGATLEWVGVETGRKYTLKTNNKGEYFSLGISPGKYNIKLMKDGQQLYYLNNVPVPADEFTQDIDLKKEAEKGPQGMSAEQVKQLQEQQAQVAKENVTIKSLNEKLQIARTASEAGDYDTAIKTMTEATEMDANRDLLWFNLANYYRMSAPKQTDPAEKQKRFETAMADYEKAIQLKKATDAAAQQKDANFNTTLAAYYNNLADAYHKSNRNDDAVKAYEQAAALDPAHTSGYLFNIGAVYTNAGKVDDAIAAFDKVIAADPNKAEAYYWKGVNLIGKETMDKDNKVVAPPGTAEAFQKYLELQPTGPFAEPAKQMLASIGASIETTFGTKKKPATKK